MKPSFQHNVWHTVSVQQNFEFNKLTSTFFLFGDLKNGLRETVQISNYSVSEKGGREIFLLLKLYFYKIHSLGYTQKLENSICKRIPLLSPSCSVYAFPCLVWSPRSAPSSTGTVSSVQTWSDDASILLDMADHNKGGIKIQFPKVICRLHM